MPSRRGVLAMLAGVSTSALAGCANEDGPATNGTNTARSEGNRTTTTTTAESTTTTSDPTTTTTTPPTERTLEFGEPVELEGGTVKLHDPFRRHSAVTIQADTARVYEFGGRNGQAVFVRVSATEGAPAGESFSLVADSTYAPLREKMPLYPLYYLPDEYTAERGSGWVAFEVPAPFDPDTAPRVELETESGTLSWALPDSFARALRREPPDFELRAFETPESVTSGEEVTATVEVENTGDDGTFRGAVNTAGPIHTAYSFEFDVPAGETRRKEVYAESVTGSDTLYLSLVGAGIEGVSRREVAVEPSQ